MFTYLYRSVDKYNQSGDCTIFELVMSSSQPMHAVRKEQYMMIGLHNIGLFALKCRKE